MCAAIGPSVIAYAGRWEGPDRRASHRVSGNLPGLRSEGAEHESPEFLLAKVSITFSLQPSTSAIVSSASTKPLSGALGVGIASRTKS